MFIHLRISKYECFTHDKNFYSVLPVVRCSTGKYQPQAGSKRHKNALKIKFEYWALHCRCHMMHNVFSVFQCVTNMVPVWTVLPSPFLTYERKGTKVLWFSKEMKGFFPPHTMTYITWHPSSKLQGLKSTPPHPHRPLRGLGWLLQGKQWNLLGERCYFRMEKRKYIYKKNSKFKTQATLNCAAHSILKTIHNPVTN